MAYDFRKTSLCVAHSGADPVWRGLPDYGKIHLIQAHTHQDVHGRFYYREDPQGPWRPLRTQRDFDHLNWVLSEWQPMALAHAPNIGRKGL